MELLRCSSNRAAHIGIQCGDGISNAGVDAQSSAAEADLRLSKYGLGRGSWHGLGPWGVERVTGVEPA
jgi:hypothetical protein